MPSKDSTTASSSTGLCDYYFCNNSTSYTFGVLRGGATYDTTAAGAFYFFVGSHLAHTNTPIGFRSMFVLS